MLRPRLFLGVLALAVAVSSSSSNEELAGDAAFCHRTEDRERCMSVEFSFDGQSQTAEMSTRLTRRDRDENENILISRATRVASAKCAALYPQGGEHEREACTRQLRNVMSIAAIDDLYKRGWDAEPFMGLRGPSLWAADMGPENTHQGRRRHGVMRRWGFGLTDLSPAEVGSLVSTEWSPGDAEDEIVTCMRDGSGGPEHVSAADSASLLVLGALHRASVTLGLSVVPAPGAKASAEGSPPPTLGVVLRADQVGAAATREWLHATMRLQLRLRILCKATARPPRPPGGSCPMVILDGVNQVRGLLLYKFITGDNWRRTVSSDSEPYSVGATWGSDNTTWILEDTDSAATNSSTTCSQLCSDRQECTAFTWVLARGRAHCFWYRGAFDFLSAPLERAFDAEVLVVLEAEATSGVKLCRHGHKSSGSATSDDVARQGSSTPACVSSEDLRMVRTAAWSTVETLEIPEDENSVAATNAAREIGDAMAVGGPFISVSADGHAGLSAFDQGLAASAAQSSMKVREPPVSLSTSSAACVVRARVNSLRSARAVAGNKELAANSVAAKVLASGELRSVPSPGSAASVISRDRRDPLISPSLRRLAQGKKRPLRVISLYDSHDSAVTVAEGGQIKLALELERITGLRYYMSCYEESRRYKAVWNTAVKTASHFVGLAGASQEAEYDVAVTVGNVGRARLPGLYAHVNAKRWVHVPHHRAHATHAFVDSPFRAALVLSYDGAGDDGTFLVYYGWRDDREDAEDVAFETTDLGDPHLRELASFPGSLGGAYVRMGMMFPEIVGARRAAFDAFANREGGVKPLMFNNGTQVCSFKDCEGGYHIPGRLMGYAATGSVRTEWLPRVAGLLNGLEDQDDRLQLYETHPMEGFDEFPDSPKVQRDLAATAQQAFENIVVDRMRPFVDVLPHVDGIVVTGGCGLNIKANKALQDAFGLPVWVTSAPNDAGLTVGGAWSVASPRRDAWQPLQFLGLPIAEAQWIPVVAAALGARETSVGQLARLLADGHIIGVMRGRQEFGPRALGHRSLMASPAPGTMRERLNRLKRREWYRPVAPMVTPAAMRQIFEDAVHSPYMSFGSQLTERACRAYPAICHFDGSARPQTVSRDDDAWLHDLLAAVGKLIGAAVLCNTSFNTHGRPIINSALEALKLLRDEDDLDFVFLDRWLFDKTALRGLTDAQLEQWLPQNPSNLQPTREGTSSLLSPAPW